MDDDAPPGVPEWVVTYGDMMSLLLTFFIMLVSMSELKEEGKVRAILEVFQQRFGPTDGLAASPGPLPMDRNNEEHATADGRQRPNGTDRETADGKQQVGTFNGATDSSPDSPAALAGPAAFRPNDATLRPEMARTLDTLAAAVERAGLEVVVRGHASPAPLPPDSPFADAWALSRARAEAVAAALVERGVAPRRLRVEAAGAWEPPDLGGQDDPNAPPRAWDRVDVLIGEN